MACMKTCPLCMTDYIPKHPSKADAFATSDYESREQWISGCCGNACWTRNTKDPVDELIDAAESLMNELAPSTDKRERLKLAVKNIRENRS